MSLLIKALQKAEQSKDAKNGDKKVAKTGLELELAPQEPKAEVFSQLEAVATEPQNPGNSSFSFTENENPDTALEPNTIVHHAEPEPSLIDELGFNLADEAGFAEPAEAPKVTETPKKIETPQFVVDRPPSENRAAEAIIPPPAITPTTNKTPEIASQREAAASMLSLQKEEKRKPQNTNRRSFYMGAIGLSLLLILGGGFYYYLETLDQPQLIAMNPPPVQTPPAVAPATPATADTPETPVEPELVEAVPPATASGTDSVPTTTEEEKAKSVASAPKENGVSEEVEAKPANTAQKTKKTQATASGDNPMKVARMRKSEPTTNPTQVAAYQAFLAGDDQAAERLYRQLLQSDPRNVDALLGLAAVASRQDKVDEAVRTYQHALELDPRNSIAQAGLITMLGQTNPGEAESRLKSLLAQQPDSAYLHAALGNTYSELNRWPEAQQSYFQAFSMDSGNADYAFNLAVSLDQMGKYDLALDYYQKAASLAAKQGGSVDKVALDNRVNQLRSILAK